MTRIALIHALNHSVEPINTAFEQHWPEATRMNLLDDSLSSDLVQSGHGLDAAMEARFQTLAQYAIDAGANAVLFTCSAFGPCIEAVARRHARVPVLKPNEAMVYDAVATVKKGDKLGLIATFAKTLETMPAEFPSTVTVETAFADGALEALGRGDALEHDRLIALQASALRDRGCTHIALAQFSMARARNAAMVASGVSVLTTVDSAVRALRYRLS